LATLTVNGSALPEPNKLTNNLYMIGDSKRNALGTMNLQYIANKRTYNAVWGTMTAGQLNTLISLIKSTSPQFSLSVLDPGAGGGVYSGNFYAGDLSYIDVKIDTYGNVTFETVKVDLIEC